MPKCSRSRACRLQAPANKDPRLPIKTKPRRMNFPRFGRAALPILSLLLFPFTFRGQDIAPPDLWDIATGEQIPAAEVLKTKDLGAIVLSSDNPGRIRIFRRKFATLIVTADQGGPAG